MKQLYAILVWIFTFTLVTACNETPQPQPKQVQYVQPAIPVQQEVQQQQATQQQVAPAPQVIYQQAPVQPAPAASGGHDGTDMLMAGAVGYLAGRVTGGGGGGNSGPSYSSNPTTVVNKTIVNKTIVQQAPPAPKPAAANPVYKSSASGYSYRSSSSSSSVSRRK